MLEAVPNVSEGRSSSAIAEIGASFGSNARLLDVHSDPDHHRSVYTLVGDPDGLVSSLVAGIATTRDLVDLRVHEGVHPRVGAADVVPLVYLDADSRDQAKAAAVEVARRAGEELELPVFLYGDVGGGRRPAFFRRRGLAELEHRMASGELVPRFGPSTIDPRHGVVLVGARKPLAAYNLDLSTDDVFVAVEIAAAVRESSGGLPGVQAIGLNLRLAGRVQVSLNVLDLERTPVHRVVEAVTLEAQARGVEVVGGELVGLVPRSVLTAAEEAGIVLPGIDASRVLERLIQH